MTTYTPTSVSTTTVAGGGAFGPDAISDVIQFTLNSHGLNNGDRVYVSSGSVSNAAFSNNNSTGITIGSGSSTEYAAWEVHQNDSNTFFLKIQNTLAVQQSGQTISNSSIAFKKASGVIQNTDNEGGGNYTNGDSIRFSVDDGGTNYDGYNWVLYQSGLNSGMSGSNVNADLDNNPSSSYAATKVGGPPEYYTLSGVTADGTTNNLFSGGSEILLLFVATSGGGGGGSGGKMTIKGSGKSTIKSSGKITVK
jgi:hypothetical protein